MFYQHFSVQYIKKKKIKKIVHVKIILNFNIEYFQGAKLVCPTYIFNCFDFFHYYGHNCCAASLISKYRPNTQLGILRAISERNKTLFGSEEDIL